MLPAQLFISVSEPSQCRPFELAVLCGTCEHGRMGFDMRARRGTALSVAVLVMAPAGQAAAGRVAGRAAAGAQLQRGDQQNRVRREVIGYSVEGRPIVAWVEG